MSKKQKIRLLALCVFRHKNSILVFEGHDSKKKKAFYRPLGGGVEFGETTSQALRREIREELKAEIKRPKLLGITENIFKYEGEPGHEVIYIFDAKFKDKNLYKKKSLDAFEGRNDELHFEAKWVKLSQIEKKQIPLYPDGLLELLKLSETKGE